MQPGPEVATGPGWTLTCGDCLDPVSGLASLADKSVDHVITDPPYEAEAHTHQRRTLNGGGDRGGMLVEGAEIDFVPITEGVRSGAAGQMARLTRRWVLAFCQAEAVAAWRDALADAGLVYKRACIWVKPNGQPQLTGDRPGMGYESMALVHAPGRSRWNGGGRHGVYTFPMDANFSRVAREHPTQKPLALMSTLLRDFTDPGELVCDPFAGSGTTGVACLRLGRRFVGWERDPKYFAVAVKRLTAAREQLRMFEGVG